MSFAQTATWDGVLQPIGIQRKLSTNAVPTSSNDVIIPNVTNNQLLQAHRMNVRI